MQFRDTACCAVEEISGLSGHGSTEGSGRVAMLAFCHNLDCSVPGGPTTLAKPSGFYIFTAVVALGTGKAAKPREGLQYGPNFAKFIEDNNLGEVTASHKAFNRRNHPDHLDQVWVWTPNYKTLKAWWAANKGK